MVAFVCRDNILSILYLNKNLTSRLEHPSNKRFERVGAEATIYDIRNFQGGRCGTIVSVEEGGRSYAILKKDQNTKLKKNQNTKSINPSYVLR